MAGHSKWANIKHRKAASDAKKGKVFTKMAKVITVAAQQGGGDMEMNPSLRVAVQKAKSAGVPNDNIDRAIKKGTGELQADRLEEMVYEGYGPGGAALLIRCLTDNTNRSYRNLRDIMKKNGGSVGTSGCVAWMFERKGVLQVDGVEGDQDELGLMMIEAGAEECDFEGNSLMVVSSPEAFEQVCKSIGGGNVQRSEITLLAQEKKVLDDVQNAKDLQVLIEKLEEDDDVDEVFTNAEFSEGVLKTLGM